jgi:chromosome segregation protein
VYLRNLDILGFKSFANKTTVRFSEGVTAIVGPNGCGKTNILDALRWVLGEQRPTLLRGSKMEEIIFNGTRELKPLGMAEVTLTVINDRGVLPTEYHEVQISRRLFRSGESEYLLNKVPCRLKDIADLFTDTGMGAHSYSVIQQDMIDSVISDKAEERRFLFEEAAGITKYKHRKKAALRKLEATESDFLRLKDIHTEVKTQVNSLYRQHKKAERYQKVADNIKQWELYLSSSRVKSLDQEKRHLRADLDSLNDKKLRYTSELDQITLQLENDRHELLDIERELNQLNQQMYDCSEEAHRREQDISILREKKNSSGNLIDRNTADLSSLSARLYSLEEQLIDSAKDLAGLQTTYEKCLEETRDAETAQSEADRRLLEARSLRENEQRKLIEIESRLSSGKTEETNLKEQESELNFRLAEIQTHLDDCTPRQQELISSVEKFQQTIDSLHSRKVDLERQQTALNLRMESLLEQGEELALEISSHSASIEACEARRNLLNDMMVHYEGHESGVIAAMSVRDRWPGIVGTVADKLVPVDGMESALESALGNLAGFVICKDRSTAEEIIRFLKTEKKGRIGILVPDTGIINPAVKRPEMNAPGFLGWLETFVSTDIEIKPLMEAVLSRTAVFSAGSNPDEILERLPYGFSAVSTDGVLYSRNMLTGGSDDRFPLFRRKEKLQEQEHLITEFNQKLHDAKEKKNQCTAELARSRADSNTISTSIEMTSEELETNQKQLSELDFQRRSLTSEFERYDKERNQIRSRIENLKNRQFTLGLDFDELAGIRERLVLDMTQSVNRLDEFEKAVSDTLENVAKLQVASVEARSRMEQTESRITHLKEIARDIQLTIDTKKKEIEQAQLDSAAADERVQILERELKDLFELRENLTRTQESLRGKQGEAMEKTSTRETQIKAIRENRDSLSEEIHALEIRLNTMDSEIKGLTEKIQEEHQLDINSIDIPCPDPSFTELQAREHLHQQKELLRKFGAVNLLALEEYRTAFEREKFLNEQLTDLTTARDDLQTTILKINQTARLLFVETFNKARENFKTLFQELFNGGEADIMLEDQNDPLESNIDIIARPRGKKLLSITMMSGGERALTAISLLFALYLVKPSPFCILDEIDAPLDDANCHRFLKIIRKFSGQTQFIAITHNKITMEAADNLYGITMEQPGVSKLVAVKFTDDGNGASAVTIVQDSEEPSGISVSEVSEDVLPIAEQEQLEQGIIIPDNNDN